MSSRSEFQTKLDQMREVQAALLAELFLNAESGYQPIAKHLIDTLAQLPSDHPLRVEADKNIDSVGFKAAGISDLTAMQQQVDDAQALDPKEFTRGLDDDTGLISFVSVIATVVEEWLESFTPAADEEQDVDDLATEAFNFVSALGFLNS